MSCKQSEDKEEDAKVEKWCKECGKSETAAKKACGESDDGLHKFIEREVVTAETKKTYKLACKICKDAKAYDIRQGVGARPNMKTQAKGKFCRNPDCDMYPTKPKS